MSGSLFGSRECFDEANSSRGRACRPDRRSSHRHRLRVASSAHTASRAAGDSGGPGAGSAARRAASRRPRRPWRPRRSAGERSRQRDRRLRSKAADQDPDARGGGQEDLAAARIQARARADGPGDRGVRADCLRRQRPDVRPRAAQLHAGRGRGRRAGSDQPHLDARGQGQRRQVRDAQGLRRQAGVPALRHALRRQRGSDDGVERRRGVEVHRHQQRRRRRQEGFCSPPGSAGSPTSSTSSRACSGPWTTGSTARSTRSVHAPR